MQTEKKCSCRKSICIISGILFAVVAIAHLVRAINGWSMTWNTHEIPMWSSWVVVVVGAVFAAGNFCACCCKKCGECGKTCCDRNDKNQHHPKNP